MSAQFECPVCGHKKGIPATNDMVHNPSHYTSGGIECIDALKASMPSEEFKGFLKGNVMKYLWRYQMKGKPRQDLETARWYLDRLIEEVEA